jgi:hypothetical protein
MEVYTFEKTLENRLQEIQEILITEDPKVDFKNFLEAAIEPCYWNAIWKIPKATCQGMISIFNQNIQPIISMKPLFQIWVSNFPAKCSAWLPK